tara:strand:- start:2480 stop:3571 length:1092 start_codon:yes stop_codon:yes gene_type:complete
MKSFSDFNTELLQLKLKLEGKTQEDIANVAGDGAVSMPPTARKVIKKKKTFSVSPAVFDMFRRGKKKFEKWSKYLDLTDESQRAIYSWAIKNHQGVLILQNAVTGEVRAIRHNRMGGGQWHKLSRGIQVSEKTDMPKKVLDDAEDIVKELKKKKADFVKRYGADAKKVMYATAMKMAKAKHNIEGKEYGSIIRQIKDSISKIGVKKEDINTKAEKSLYETPAPTHEDNINTLKDIVETQQVKKIVFEKYGSMRVNPEEAKVLLKVYNELKEDLKEKFIKMLNFNQMGLKSLKNMCFEIATYGEPQGLARPIASIGNMKSPRSRPAYALNAQKKKKKEAATGPGLNTIKPMMNITARKKHAGNN